MKAEEFLKRNSALHRNQISVIEASEKAYKLAEGFKEVIDKVGGSYEDVNQAVILVDNGFYKKTLKTNHHIETSE